MVTLLLKLAIDRAIKELVRLSAPRARWVVGAVHLRSFLGRPSAFVLPPHPLGFARLLLPARCRLRLMSVLGWLPRLGPSSQLSLLRWLPLAFDLGVKGGGILPAVPCLGRGPTGLPVAVHGRVRAVGRVIWGLV
jgi:hypothetical protein